MIILKVFNYLTNKLKEILFILKFNMYLLVNEKLIVNWYLVKLFHDSILNILKHVF